MGLSNETARSFTGVIQTGMTWNDEFSLKIGGRRGGPGAQSRKTPYNDAFSPPFCPQRGRRGLGVSLSPHKLGRYRPGAQSRKRESAAVALQNFYSGIHTRLLIERKFETLKASIYFQQGKDKSSQN